MKFWDSSAIVPLVVEEPASPACRQLFRADPVQVVFCLARTEVVSALWRQARQRALARVEVQRAERRLDRLAVRWAEVDALHLVRETAERLLRIHALHAADALQLGAALVAFDHRPRGRSFVALDDALLAAAEAEGFDAAQPGNA